MEFILPVLDHRERRWRCRTGSRDEEALPIQRYVELEIPGGAILRSARDREERLGVAEFQRTLDRHRVKYIIQANVEELGAIGAPPHQPRTIARYLSPL